MPTFNDAAAPATEAQVLIGATEARWQQIAVDSQADVQTAFSKTPKELGGYNDMVTLEVPSLDGSKSLTPESRVLDPRTSAAQLVREGVFIDKTTKREHDFNLTDSNEGSAPDGNVANRSDNVASEARMRPISRITVLSSNAHSSPSKTPDFVVRADGEIIMLRNPDTSNSGNITIQVEETGLQMRSAQKRNLDGLVTYLAERMMKSTGDGQRSGSIVDREHLSNPELKNILNLAEHDTATNTLNFSAAPGESGSYGGSSSTAVGDTDSYSGGSSTAPRYSSSSSDTSWRDSGHSGTTNEDQSIADSTLSDNAFKSAVKDVVAFMNDATGPQRYDLVTQTSKNEYEVGPYNIGYEKILDWLQALLGNPPDLSKLDELVKKGLLSKDMIEKIKSRGFENFVKGLKTGIMPSADQAKTYLPRAVQELIADCMIEKFATQFKSGNHADVGKVALSLELGHAATPDELMQNTTFLHTATERSGIVTNQAGGTGSINMENLTSIFFTQFSHPQWNPYGDAPSSSSNCGPASLAMVLRMLGIGPEGVDLYGDPNPLVSQVKRMMTGTDDPGVTTDVGQAAAAAQELGLTTAVVGNLEQIDRALDEGRKIVLGGDPIAYNQDFTADQYATHPNGDGTSSIFVGGHIIAVEGKDEHGNYVVLDPAYKEGVLILTPSELLGFMAPDGDYAGIAIGQN